MGSNQVEELLKLGAAERLAIAEQLWESVALEAEARPAISDEIAFIDNRLDAYLKNPKAVKPWSEVKRELGL